MGHAGQWWRQGGSFARALPSEWGLFQHGTGGGGGRASPPAAGRAVGRARHAAAAPAALSPRAGGGKPLSGVPRLAVRTALALAILFVAKSLPFLAYVMALVGSFMTISVSVTFPALCHLAIHRGRLSASKVRARARRARGPRWAHGMEAQVIGPRSVCVLHPLPLHKGGVPTSAACCLQVALNYLVALIGIVCTASGTLASMKSLAAKAAASAAGAA